MVHKCSVSFSQRDIACEYNPLILRINLVTLETKFLSDRVETTVEWDNNGLKIID